jgi:hypothetical protein
LIDAGDHLVRMAYLAAGLLVPQIVLIGKEDKSSQCRYRQEKNIDDTTLQVSHEGKLKSFFIK